ncbi:MAG: cobyrinate a,c-diamide synthase [Chromatiales bacterium]|jgi:cobyrinic acid a,c-diamide synthase|nr:cobyrinate a,c-diamide synthase [Chromatiales bacterium]MDX9766198.1 cobyrinate a,c-diamide synthase [Ectothiorhodospiraceae bacterium]
MRILVSAAHKSSGKTTVTLGLCAALRARGLRVQPYKKGPDYIDPLWLGHAAGRPCVNLDFYTMSHDEIVTAVGARAQDSDIAVIEGNKGLFDGLDLDGSNSNAALARLLATPVVLVIDARGMTRGIAPLLLGYQAFEADIRIAGVILNRLGGSRHESKLRAVIEHYTDVAVIGAVHEDRALEIVERHLGLMPSNEHAQAGAHIARIADRIRAQVDLDRLLDIAATTTPISIVPSLDVQTENAPKRRIGVARDAAFGFYYQTDLEALERNGAELVFFDTLHDSRLPALDGLFIGGGFPETHMQALEANRAMRHAIRQAIDDGLPAYAECGGLMYLARSISWNGKRHAMVGVIEGDVVMHEKPQGRGYVRLQETADGLWPDAQSAMTPFSGHEFHYSSIENLPADTRFAYQVLRGHGVDGRHDGIVYRNLLASYSHLRDTAQQHWTRRFMDFVRGRITGTDASLPPPGTADRPCPSSPREDNA